MAKHNHTAQILQFKPKKPFIHKVCWMVLVLQLLGLGLISYLILK